MSEVLAQGIQAEYAPAVADHIAQMAHERSDRAIKANISANPAANLAPEGVEFSYRATMQDDGSVLEGLRRHYHYQSDRGRGFDTDARLSYTTHLPSGAVRLESDDRHGKDSFAGLRGMPRGETRFITTIDVDPVRGTVGGMYTHLVYRGRRHGWVVVEQNRLAPAACQETAGEIFNILDQPLMANEQEHAARAQTARHLQQLLANHRPS